MDDLVALAQSDRPDGPPWFPYAFLAVAALVGVFLVVRFLKRRR
ncbi:hypothetical protein [Streptomyces sp. NBC_00083]|nr:hypothetical protein [Streptomyces sp. NBC_00083]MCX5386483.1 hypothetical protein [Streptomyces sp. NBC_00083]